MRRNGHERRNDGEGRAEVFHLHGAVRGRESLYGIHGAASFGEEKT